MLKRIILGMVAVCFLIALLTPRLSYTSALGALLAVVNVTTKRSSQELKAEFHQTYPLAPGGRVALKNISGDVKISGWSRDEVRVDAVKRAYSERKLNEAEIKVASDSGSISIETVYLSSDLSWTDHPERKLDNPVVADYSLMVPHAAIVDSVQLTNGSLLIEGVTGALTASCTNGKLVAHGLANAARLSTVNNTLEAAFDRLDGSKPVWVESVNGRIHVSLPIDANGEVRAVTTHGRIVSNLGLSLRRQQSRSSLISGVIGHGGERIQLTNVNGDITIRHSGDASSAPQVRDLEDSSGAASLDLPSAPVPQIDPGQRETKGLPLIKTDTRSIPTRGVENVRIKTFHGAVVVHGWDKPEIAVAAKKRAGDERFMEGIRLSTEQITSSLSITADFDRAYGLQVGNSVSIRARVEFDIWVPRGIELEIGSGHGDIAVEGIEGRTEIRTGDGNISVGGSFARLAARTGRGSITLTTPHSYDATITTEGGQVSNQRGAVAEAGDRRDRIQRWRLGRGTNQISLQTGSGVIELR
jgi:DUF4097 and DUF4098 domain-containing protein YvlB